MATTSVAGYATSKQLRRALPLVDRFLVREARLHQEQIASGNSGGRGGRGGGGGGGGGGGSASAAEQVDAFPVATLSPAAKANPYAFRTYKHPVTGRWLPPRVSLRRQAQLAKAAYRDDRFGGVVDAVSTYTPDASSLASSSSLAKTPVSAPTGSIKFDKMAARMAELGIQDGASGVRITQHRQQADREAAVAARAAADASAAAAESGSGHGRDAAATREEEKRRSVKLARALAATSGPYSGRSMRTIFKGTRAEREAPARKRNIQQRLEGMDRTVEEWRKTRKEAKLKSQPKLPF